MFTMHAVLVLVAASSILASPSKSALDHHSEWRPSDDTVSFVSKQLQSKSNNSPIHPPYALPKRESLLSPGLDTISKRQKEAANRGKLAPTRDKNTGTRNRKSNPLCSRRSTSPLPIPKNLGEIPKGYLGNVGNKLPQPGQPSTTLTHSPQGNAKSLFKKLQRWAVPSKRTIHQANCGITYRIPEVPQTRDAASLSVPGISRWWGFRYRPFEYGETDVCIQTLEQSHSPRPTTYELAYAYEPWLIKLFFNSASLVLNIHEGGLQTDCTALSAVFNTRSKNPDSRFFRETPAQALANELSCIGPTCPHESQANEFFILSTGISRMKQIAMSGRHLREQESLESEDGEVVWELSYDVTRERMSDLGLAFAFFNNPDMVAAFTHVNNRIRSVLEAVDNDPFYKGSKPFPKAHSWTALYDDWMAAHLRIVESNTARWLSDAYTFVLTEEESFSASLRAEGKAWTDFQFSHEHGQLRDDKVIFQRGYDEVFQRSSVDSIRNPGSRRSSIFRKRQNRAPSRNGIKNTPQRPGQNTASDRKSKLTCPKSGCAECKHRRTRKQLGQSPAKAPPAKPPTKLSLRQFLENEPTYKRDQLASCGIKYSLELLSRTSAPSIPGVSKWWTAIDYSISNTCGWEIGVLDDDPGEDTQYSVTYAYSPGFIKLFLNDLAMRTDAGSHAASVPLTREIDCSVVPRVFNTLSTAPNSKFRDITPAQALANIVSLHASSSADDPNAVYLLETSVSDAKDMILNGVSSFSERVDEKLSTYMLESLMTNVTLAFQFMNEDASAVADSFTVVNQRIRQTLHRVDLDPAYEGLKPHGSTSWLAAYDEWLRRHMRHAEQKTQVWLRGAASDLRLQLSSTFTAESAETIQWLDFHQQNPGGMFLPGNLRFKSNWDGVLVRTSRS